MTAESELHTNRQRERKEQLGRGRKPLGTYLLTQNKQGQPVTEQKGGSHRQKENNKKAHLNHSSKISHTKPSEAAGSGAAAPASGTETAVGLSGH